MTLEARIARIEAALKKAGLIEPDSLEYTLDRACQEAVRGNRKPLDEWCRRNGGRHEQSAESV